MERLEHKDLRALIAALDFLHADEDAVKLPERVLKVLTDLIPSDTVGVDIFDLNGKYDHLSWRNVEFEFTSERLKIIEKYHHESPLYTETILKRRTDVLKLTDFISAKDFQRTNFYKHIYAPLKATYHLAVALPISEDFTMACLLTRTNEDFSERDRLMLHFLVPHLVNAISNNFVVERLNSLLDSNSHGIVVISRSGNKYAVNKLAGEMLSRYFPKWGFCSDTLPDTVSNWVKAQAFPSGINGIYQHPKPFEINGKTGKLSARLSYNSITGERTLLLEEKKALTPQMLESLALTKREAEVLYHISQGKSDAEIALLCSISPRTVNKHTENIYIKLGVENRNAAMRRALEMVSGMLLPLVHFVEHI